ncbi:hypothetical protein DYB37_001116 [Aphanomyces astaci]|uniref:Uncharacterized protein n=1 Tax=Aphanomyces astaci TaxID=112090 RepID=A0A3R7B3E5_APHAT|nr:hypothetical protein DYB37_001116 [Aphanomyces astaci]
MHRRPVKGGTGWDCKAEGAKAAGLYYEIANVGKVLEASKKRITWRIKMVEGKEYEISLTHSIASGKKVLRIDGIARSHSTDLSSDAAVFNPFGTPSAPSDSSWVAFDKPEVSHRQPSTHHTDPFAPSPTALQTQPSSDNIASMLHGLDFNYSPPPPPPPPSLSAPVAPVVDPPADPLWGAPIIDLNLNPEAKLTPMKSTKSLQSMEQARLATTGSSTKQLQLPQPVYPPPTYQPPFQANPGFQSFTPPQHIVPPPMPNQYATYGAPPLNGGVQPRGPQQQFMANMTNVPPPKVGGQQRPTLSDPFATLS